MITNKINIFALLVLAFFMLPAGGNSAEAGKGYFGTAPKEQSKRGVIAVKKTFDPALGQELVYRVAFGRADDVKLLLDKGADPETRNSAGLPVLLIAIIRKDDEAPKIVSALVKAGANVNKVAPNGNIPVLEAVKSGRTDILQILIDNRAVLGVVHDQNGADLLSLAEARGSMQVVNILNAGLENEKDKIQALKSADNFLHLVQHYAFLSCANEYLNFYISTAPKGVNMVAFNDVVTENNFDQLEAGAQIKMLFRMKDNELQVINNASRGSIYNQLQYYETNENRALNGVGTDADLNNRCEKIASKYNASKMNMDQYRANTQ